MQAFIMQAFTLTCANLGQRVEICNEHLSFYFFVVLQKFFVKASKAFTKLEVCNSEIRSSQEFHFKNSFWDAWYVKG